MDKYSEFRNLKIAVAMGGFSSEREISLLSGSSVVESLSRLGLKVFPLDLKSKESFNRDYNQFDVIFNALHGRGGEDGFLQSILEANNIKFTGSNSEACKVSMNKIETKKIWREAGFPTPDFVEITNVKTANMQLNQFVTEGNDITSLDKSYVVKPAREGSSFGISIVKPNQGSLEEAMELASKFDADILTEAFVDGKEVTVAILGEKALSPIIITTNNKFYDYDAKYISKKTNYEVANFGPKLTQHVQDLAINAFNSLGCEGWGRVDFIQDKEENFQLLEINTVPGLTQTSLVPKAAEHDGIDFNNLIIEIIKLAIT